MTEADGGTAAWCKHCLRWIPAAGAHDIGCPESEQAALDGVEDRA